LHVARDSLGHQGHGQELPTLIGRNAVHFVTPKVGVFPLLETGVIPLSKIACLCSASEHLLSRQSGHKARVSSILPRAQCDTCFGQFPMTYPPSVIVFVKQHVGIYDAHVFGRRYADHAEWFVAGYCRHVIRYGVRCSAARRVAGAELCGTFYHAKCRFAVGCTSKVRCIVKDQPYFIRVRRSGVQLAQRWLGRRGVSANLGLSICIARLAMRSGKQRQGG